MIDSVGKSFKALRLGAAVETEEKETVCLSSLVLHSLTRTDLVVRAEWQRFWNCRCSSEFHSLTCGIVVAYCQEMRKEEKMTDRQKICRNYQTITNTQQRQVLGDVCCNLHRTTRTQHHAAFKVHLPPRCDDGSATTVLLQCDWLVKFLRYQVVKPFTVVPQWTHQHSLLVSWGYFTLQMATKTREEINYRLLLGFQPQLRHYYQPPATPMHAFLFSWTHQRNPAGSERNDSCSHGEQYFEMQANGPSNSDDILLWNKKNEQQPVTFGEQLGCFGSEKARRKALVIRNKMTRAFQVWRFKFYSPLWYIFDHSWIPCGALGTQFPPVSGLHLQPQPASLNGHTQSGALRSTCIPMCTWM